MNSVTLAFEGQSLALQTVYSSLVANAQHATPDNSGVCLSSVQLRAAQYNTKLPDELFARYLVKLESIGLYRPVDGKAFGEVRIS